MPRSSISFPDKFTFTTELTVRVADINYGGHVGNDSILTLMQEARVLFYQSLGYANEISIEGSIGQLITEATVEYKSESFLGDVLVFQLGVGNIANYGFTMFYRVTNKANGKEVALGKTGIACFDHDKRKLAPIPELFRKKLTG